MVGKLTCAAVAVIEQVLCISICPRRAAVGRCRFGLADNVIAYGILGAGEVRAIISGFFEYLRIAGMIVRVDQVVGGYFTC